MPETNTAKRRVKIGPDPFNWRRHLLRQAIGEAISFAAYFGAGTKAWLNPEFSIYFRLVETLRPFWQSVGGDRRE
jgi:hypothetical protein